MEFKSFNAAQIQANLNTVIDQIEQSTETAIGYVQPELARTTLSGLNKAYFNFTRSAMDNAVEFNRVVGSINKEFIKMLGAKK